MGEKGKRILDNIEYDLYDAKNANEYLKKLIDFTKGMRYTAIINDSITMMTSSAVNWSLSFRDTKSKTKDRIIPDWDEYKVETSLVSQALDISRNLPCYIIWTAHPVPRVTVEGSGGSIKVTKVNPIVSYGSKVAGIVPGSFSEIYQFSKMQNWGADGKSSTQYIVDTEAVGDDYAKSNIGLKTSFDITDRLFYEVWKEQVNNLRKELDNDLNTKPADDPFVNQSADVPANKWRI